MSDAAEESYWRFDARRKGYGEWKETPQSERDAYKAEFTQLRARIAELEREREALMENWSMYELCDHGLPIERDLGCRKCHARLMFSAAIGDQYQMRILRERISALIDAGKELAYELGGDSGRVQPHLQKAVDVINESPGALERYMSRDAK